MSILLIVLGVVLGLILLVALAILFGRAKLRITCQGKVRVTASVLGIIRLTLVSDQEPEEEALLALHRCADPDRVLKKELRRQRRLAKKALKKKEKALCKALQHKQEQKKAGQPDPNLIENLQMISALIKQFYEVTKGKITVNVKRMHLTVASKDAATTAILYGTVVQSAACLLQWIDTHFMHIKRKDGAMEIVPDYLSEKMTSDIDIVCSVNLRKALKVLCTMIIAYRSEKRIALANAKRRRNA